MARPMPREAPVTMAVRPARGREEEEEEEGGIDAIEINGCFV
jgi:hypothetical protein